MIIHHYFPNTKNSGDYFVRDGIRKLIRQRIPDAEFVDIPANAARDLFPEYGLHGRLLDKTNKEADLVIIGGSNLYKGPTYGWDWGVSTDIDSINRLEKPLILMGIGAGGKQKMQMQSLSSKIRSIFGMQNAGSSRNINPLSIKAQEEILLLNKKSIASSVRDNLTYDFLQSIGVKNHILTGCPAMYIGEEKMSAPKSNRVIITFPPLKFINKIKVKNEVIESFFETIKTAKKEGLSVEVVCHDDLDLPVAKEIFSGKNSLPIFYSENWSEHQEIFRNAGFVVAYRLHSAILSCGMGVPFALILLDHRHIGFAETLGISDWAISLEKERLKNAIPNRLVRTFQNKSPLNYNAIEEKKSELKIQMDAFLDQALKLRRKD